ncbi:beta-glucuronidase isoform X1 [Octopus sinensis]|uniref:Beta-glucuronidase n=1 Tax=Octopus sinensis TaxID=2607531 RepID=A0A6P7TLQ9_9MOLL|nr:beta-glucuronidase isoform X1 [Octopus sinensis]
MASVMFGAPSSGSQFHLVVYVLLYLLSPTLSLRVQDSETRQVRCLSGMWNFRADYSANRTEGFKSKWYSKPLWQNGDVITMPVPASYNDITQERRLRDFVGWVWYDREFFVDPQWKLKTVHLRFDSVHYNAIVWVNSEFAFNHSGGHLPFEGDVTHLLKYDRAERVTVAVNNTLSPTTLPPGTITYKTDRERYPKGYFVQNLQMDFFNYAGIHRNVWLYATPQVYIMNIYINTSIQKSSGIVTYKVIPNHYAKGQRYKVKVIDKHGDLVAYSNQSTGVLNISNANLWWPYTMNTSSPAYLYTMEVTLISDTTDVYRHPFGIRTVKVNSRQLLINDQPFYCLGVGRHEDADVRGKGVDLPFIAKDFNLMKWLGVNCFRTSHYPYSEELMDEADRQGFAVIDESPGVGIERNNMEEVNLVHHKNVMQELVERDKNRPSVIIWSVANEPSSAAPKAKGYFKGIIRFTQMLDKSRPVTFVMNANMFRDKAAQFADILCINRYFGWYGDMGHPEVVSLQLPYELDNFHSLHRRPVILTEYGAGAVNGLHRSPSVAFTEEYQVDLLTATHEALDKRIGTYLAGEMVWNFADFQTAQGVKRVAGNKKGLFTRQREPKFAAFLIRNRYLALQNKTSDTGRNCMKDIFKDVRL